MGRIALLSSTVADQIAAGEVVERPASVVKELVENALDAGATSIVVEIEGGGRKSIRVIDDGCGMDRDDAVLSIDRHATSKIVAAKDLIGVPTYGFRGEALPAIASVSVFELETASAETAEATRVTVRGGRVETVEATTRQPGTTVTVGRLFFNTPARRKFLRSQRAETRAIGEALSVLALARLDVAFRLESDGRVLLDALRASDTADRIAALFGRQLAGQLLAVAWHAGSLSVRGFVQRPADAKPAGRKAYLFVNGRPFRDPFMVRAAEAGFRGAVNPGSRPTVLLAIDLPGDAVDVNVHPAKLEVRFRDRFLVERTVEEAVRAALAPLEAAAVVGGGSADRWIDGAIGGSADRSIGGPQMSTATLFDETPDAGSIAPATAHKLMQVFNTYVLMETPDGVAIIDQHSAHERILYERAMALLTGEHSAAQRLLLPLTINLEPQELEALEGHTELLTAIGFEVEPFGGNAVAVHAVPNPHRRFDAQRCFQEIVADLARGRFGGLHNRLERFAATFACRAAVKAGEHLEPPELRELVDRLFACQLPPHDVHGRPTIVRLPKSEVERRFGRA
jgi:DNA mismatch repair protein MutL